MFLGCSINHSSFQRRGVRGPTNKDNFRNVLVVVVGELEVEHNESVLAFWQVLKHVLPGLSLGTNSIDDLYSFHMYNCLLVNAESQISYFCSPELEILVLFFAGFVHSNFHGL